jgi:hypothetical protein
MLCTHTNFHSFTHARTHIHTHTHTHTHTHSHHVNVFVGTIACRYAQSMVATLVEAHLREPLVAYGFACQMIDIASCDDATVQWPAVCLSRPHVRSADTWTDRSAAVDVLEAFKGAVYRRDFLDVALLKRVPHACRRTDDIWISANLALAGIPRVKLLTDTHPRLSANDAVTPLGGQHWRRGA